MWQGSEETSKIIILYILIFKFLDTTFRYQSTKFSLALRSVFGNITATVILYGCTCNSSVAFSNDYADKPGSYVSGTCDHLGHILPIPPSSSSYRCRFALLSRQKSYSQLSLLIANWCVHLIKNISSLLTAIRLVQNVFTACHTKMRDSLMEFAKLLLNSRRLP